MDEALPTFPIKIKKKGKAFESTRNTIKRLPRIGFRLVMK